MDLLVDICSRLCANKQVADQLRADKASEGAKIPKKPSVPRATPGHPWHKQRRQMAEPRHPDPEVVADISNEVQSKVASRMRGAPVLYLAIPGGLGIRGGGRPCTHEKSP